MVNAVSSGIGVTSQDKAARKGYLNAKDDGKGSTSKRVDTLVLGKNTPLSDSERANLVVERALDRLRSVVGDAKKQLGIPDDATVDTSPDATAGRIADFALGFFDKYAKQHGLQNDEDGRKAYADFIGGAISKGIDEARGILGSLNALDGSTSSNIDKTAEAVQKRLDDFVKNGPAAAA